MAGRRKWNCTEDARKLPFATFLPAAGLLLHLVNHLTDHTTQTPHTQMQCQSPPQVICCHTLGQHVGSL